LLSATVKQRACTAWGEYEKAIVDAWKFPKNARLLADNFAQNLEAFDDAQMEKFIHWLHEQTKEIRSMKWVG
jgi:hypothetical protein